MDEAVWIAAAVIVGYHASVDDRAELLRRLGLAAAAEQAGE